MVILYIYFIDPSPQQSPSSEPPPLGPPMPLGPQGSWMPVFGQKSIGKGRRNVSICKKNIYVYIISNHIKHNCIDNRRECKLKLCKPLRWSHVICTWIDVYLWTYYLPWIEPSVEPILSIWSKYAAMPFILKIYQRHEHEISLHRHNTAVFAS